MIKLSKNVIVNKTRHVRNNTSTIYPNMKTKIFLPNFNKEQIKKPVYSSKTSLAGSRYNQLGIQMLSKNIYDQVFLEGNKSKIKSIDFMEECRKVLLKNNMITKKEDFIPDVDFKLPPLKGESIEEHFKLIGEEQAKPYRELVLKLLEGIPQAPKNWLMQEGWTRYEHGCEPQQVLFPLDEILVFDIEVSISIKYGCLNC